MRRAAITWLAVGAATLATLYWAVRAYAVAHNVRRAPRDCEAAAVRAICRAHAARFALRAPLRLVLDAPPLTIDWRLVDVPRVDARSWRTAAARAKAGVARYADGRWRYESA